MSKILIIEDDKFLRELLQVKLKKENFSVFVAVNGEEGIKKAQEEQPDLILLDLILPNIDGFEVLKRIRDNPAIAAIKVIVLSNLGQKEDVERALNLGAVDYLVKAHFTLDEIVKKAKKHL